MLLLVVCLVVTSGRCWAVSAEVFDGMVLVEDMVVEVVDVLGETWSTAIFCEFIVSVVLAAVGTAVCVNREAVCNFVGRCPVGTKAVDLGSGVVRSLEDVFSVSTGIVSVVSDFSVVILLLWIVGASAWELFGVVAEFTMLGIPKKKKQNIKYLLL